MTEYILFIDTEISDIPRQWQASTNEVEKWPHILQIAWTICNKSGTEVLTRDFYINPGNIYLNEDSQKLHKITLELLQEKGFPRENVMKILSDDIANYRPMIVGHFLNLDRKMMEVGFNRAQIEQNFNDLPKFCTMRNTQSPFERLDSHRFLRLNELYFSLFGKEMENQHNALADALATKTCFFEQISRGDITEKSIHRQQRYFEERPSHPWIFLFIFIVVALVAIFYFLVRTKFLK
jgi:DNA polymerase III subunit epsilon